MRLNTDPGVFAPVASLPPSRSLWQEVICDLSGGEYYVCLEMVPEGRHMDTHVLPGWLCAPDPELSVQIGVELTDPSQVKTTFGRCAARLGADWGTSAARGPCAFWANHFHPLILIFSSNNKAI